MAKTVFVTTDAYAKIPAKTARQASLEEATRRARFLLGNGAASVRIVDDEGRVLTPPVMDPPGVKQET